MKRPKFIKNINCTVREDMFLEVDRICEKKDITLSEFFRQAIKLKIEQEIENEKRN